MKKCAFLMLIAMFTMAFAGCDSATNTSNNARNVRVNNTNVNVSNANTNTNTNRWDPAISKEEYEKSRARREGDKGLDSFGDTLEESWLWFKVRSALMVADDLRETTVRVEVKKDVVVLTGTVRDEAQKKKAAEVAKVDGITSVKNELKVAPKDSVTNTGSMSDSDKTPAPKR